MKYTIDAGQLIADAGRIGHEALMARFEYGDFCFPDRRSSRSRVAALRLSSLSTLSAIASRIYLDQLIETEAIRLLSLSSTFTVTVPLSLPWNLTRVMSYRHYRVALLFFTTVAGVQL